MDNPPGRFRSKPNSAKIECTICGRSGYSAGRWMDSCRRDHIFTCICGRAFPTRSGIATHVRLAKGGSHARSSGVSP